MGQVDPPPGQECIKKAPANTGAFFGMASA